MFVIYTHYGSGLTFRTGPVALRRRSGLWAHYYVRDHPKSCSCNKCFRRVSAGPVPTMPEGRQGGRFYHVAAGA